MDANGVLAACFDAANTRLNTTTVGPASSASAAGIQGKLDVNGVWAAVYDRATNTIRVATL